MDDFAIQVVLLGCALWVSASVSMAFGYFVHVGSGDDEEDE